MCDESCIMGLEINLQPCSYWIKSWLANRSQDYQFFFFLLPENLQSPIPPEMECPIQELRTSVLIYATCCKLGREKTTFTLPPYYVVPASCLISHCSQIPCMCRVGAEEAQSYVCAERKPQAPGRSAGVARATNIAILAD